MQLLRTHMSNTAVHHFYILLLGLTFFVLTFLLQKNSLFALSRPSKLCFAGFFTFESNLKALKPENFFLLLDQNGKF